MKNPFVKNVDGPGYDTTRLIYNLCYTERIISPNFFFHQTEALHKIG